VKSVQTPHAKAVIDCVFPNPERQELPSRNDPVLTRGQLSYGRVDFTSSREPAYFAG
jgi:hypothetical protein